MQSFLLSRICSGLQAAILAIDFAWLYGWLSWSTFFRAAQIVFHGDFYRLGLGVAACSLVSSRWRSRDCFEMRLDHSFFCVHPPNKPKVKKNSANRRKKKKDDDEELSSLSPNDGERRKKEEDDNEEHRATTEEDRGLTWLGKTNFVEIRSFWQIFRSFDRMWSFLIMSLQAMIIIACYELKSPIQLLDEGIFENIMSIFITYSILKFIQATLDIAFTWKARQAMQSSEKFRQVVKLVVAAIWTIVLPVCFANSGRRYTCVSSQYGSGSTNGAFLPT